MTPLPRLAYLTSLYPAASHTFILREVTELRALGFEVEACSMRKPSNSHMIGPEEHAARASSFYIIQSGKNPATIVRAIGSALHRPGRLLSTLALAWRTAPPGVIGMIKQGFYLVEALVLSNHLLARKIDHLHNHFADPSANVAMLTSVLSGIPFSYTLHGPAELYEPQKWQLREKTARADFVACISHFARSQAMYFSDPEHWKKLHIIHCGVVPDQYDHKIPCDEHPSDEPPVDFVFVGRLTPIKGLRVLMDAFEVAHAQHPELRLILVGDGDDREWLEHRAAPFGDAIRFTGFLSQGQVAETLAKADAMVLPSFAEGLPVVLMEALAAGKPVLCTQVAGVSELVENGKSGFVVAAGDAASLAEHMIRLAKDPELRVAMGSHGRQKIQAEFDVRLEAARIATLFVTKNTTDIRPKPFKT